MIAWILTAALIDPPKTAQTPLKESYIFTTQKDCKQGEELRKQIAQLRNEKTNIRCSQIELLDPDKL
ncbi:hypothetical protein [Stutzerimonas frequens]|uniref:hypothetical protein n=1 Tax=Stutzerimonas frequens TaxID=2968969 RepID=UPI00210D65DE|nr:hypothetical protein [Stutzerimonas frequens]MCQ4306345.1 hypothetical protein [Stutzerimonas frequens]